MQRILELYPGIAIYKVHVNELREADKNARVMSKETFDRLKENIAHDKALETLPLCTIKKREGFDDELLIISGHHRTRAARMANVTEIYVLVIERELTQDEITSKQLAHNSLSGYDDQQALKELFESINDMTARLAAGVLGIENVKMPDAKHIEVNFEFETEVITMVFLPSQLEKFDRAISLIKPSKEIMVLSKDQFESFKKACSLITKNENIRNVSAIVARMSEIILSHYEK